MPNNKKKIFLFSTVVKKTTVFICIQLISTAANFVNLLNADIWRRDANLNMFEFIATSF